MGPRKGKRVEVGRNEVGGVTEGVGGECEEGTTAGYYDHGERFVDRVLFILRPIILTTDNGPPLYIKIIRAVAQVMKMQGLEPHILSACRIPLPILSLINLLMRLN